MNLVDEFKKHTKNESFVQSKELNMNWKLLDRVINIILVSCVRSFLERLM